MKTKPQFLNGKIQAPHKNAVDKIADQMATIIAVFPGGLLCLLEEFHKEVKRQTKEAKRHNKPEPIVAKDLIDLLGWAQLVALLADEQADFWGKGESAEKNALSRFLKDNPEAQLILAKILRVMHQTLIAHLEVPTSTDPNMIGSIHKNLEYIKALKEFFQGIKGNYEKKIMQKISQK